MGCLLFVNDQMHKWYLFTKQNQQKKERHDIFCVHDTHERHHTINWSKTENVKQFIFKIMFWKSFFLSCSCSFCNNNMISNMLLKKVYFIESCNNVAFFKAVLYYYYLIYILYLLCLYKRTKIYLIELLNWLSKLFIIILLLLRS